MNTSVSDLTADDVEQLGGDALLTQFVVFELELFEKLLGIVIRALHRHHAGRLLGRTVLCEDFLRHRQQEERQDSLEDSSSIRLEDIRTA